MWWRQLVFVLGFVGLLAAQAPRNASDPWEKDLLTWRTKRAANLQAPTGWLSLVGLDWLEAGDNSFGASPGNKIVLRAKVAPQLGVLRLTPQGVALFPPKGGFPAELKVDGRAPVAGQTLAADDAKNPSKLTAGTISIMVLRRGDRTGIRTRDTRAASLATFHGLNWYPPNPAYRVQARWIPYNPPHQVQVPSVIGIDQSFTVPGMAEFLVNGNLQHLEPVLEEPDAKELFFVMRDETSKTETYQAARFLYSSFPDHGLSQPGTLVIDFNRAYNPPCSFTPYATCPLPTKGNILRVPIPAGEKRYHP